MTEHTNPTAGDGASRPYPEGFHELPLEKRNEFFAKEAEILAAKKKREAAAEAMLAEAVRTKKDPKTDGKQQTPAKVAPFVPRASKPIRFPLERALDFAPPSSEDWLIKGLIPKEGVGTLFGAPGEYKTFTAIHICLHIATGETWGGRKVKHTGPVVYIAVEGARGSKKRIQGIVKAHSAGDPQIFQISKPINFGTSNDHARALVEDITAQGVKPVLIVVDTLSASLNGGEENGPGMSMFLSNCNMLATHFGCFVLAVHHVGHNAEGRERGHSSLGGNTDTRISCTKPERLRASITFEKVKDDEDRVQFSLELEKVLFGMDEDGDPITTLAVMSAVEVEAEPKKADKGTIPPQERLLMDMVEQAVLEAGQDFHIPEGPKVRVASEEAIRSRYYARLAEKADRARPPTYSPEAKQGIPALTRGSSQSQAPHRSPARGRTHPLASMSRSPGPLDGWTGLKTPVQSSPGNGRWAEADLRPISSNVQAEIIEEFTLPMIRHICSAWVSIRFLTALDEGVSSGLPVLRLLVLASRKRRQIGQGGLGIILHPKSQPVPLRPGPGREPGRLAAGTWRLEAQRLALAAPIAVPGPIAAPARQRRYSGRLRTPGPSPSRAGHCSAIGLAGGRRAEREPSVLLFTFQTTPWPWHFTTVLNLLDHWQHAKARADVEDNLLEDRRQAFGGVGSNLAVIRL